MRASLMTRCNQAQDMLVMLSAPTLRREIPVRPPLRAPLADRLSAKSLGILLHARRLAS